MIALMGRQIKIKLEMAWKYNECRGF